MQESEIIEQCQNIIDNFCIRQIAELDIYTLKNLMEETIKIIDKKNKEINALDNRLKHLLFSNTIKKYDAKDGRGCYIEDICELDERKEQDHLIECSKKFQEKYIEEFGKNQFSQGVISELRRQNYELLKTIK